mmetsp:Transcript_128793/g.209889  ORF Transcript_128793/g.209889 Transcript_128793/m.209889 type:complete len:86 (+) Transcript_128793:972-1229(+)
MKWKLCWRACIGTRQKQGGLLQLLLLWKNVGAAVFLGCGRSSSLCRESGQSSPICLPSFVSPLMLRVIHELRPYPITEIETYADT